MGYHISRTLGDSFDQVVDRVKERLKEEGFGVLTEINVKETLKEKLNVDFLPVMPAAWVRCPRPGPRRINWEEWSTLDGR